MSLSLVDPDGWAGVDWAGEALSTNRPLLIRTSAERHRGLSRPAMAVAMATIGFAATFWVWALLASLVPELTHRFGLEPLPLGLLVGVSLAVGALGRFLVGVLTDRYGARLMLPAVSVIAAVSLVAATFVPTAPALIAMALAFGVAGTTFGVGVALVSRCVPPGRRGWALGVFGTGLAGAALAGLICSQTTYPQEWHTVFRPTAAALVAFAVLVAAVVRDGPGLSADPSLRRAAVAALRMPALPRLAVLYAVAFGTLIAAVMYLPTYLRIQYRLDWNQALLLTAAFVAVAAVLRPAGGALADRQATPRALTGGFALAGVCALAQAFAPPLLPLAVLALAGMAVGLGTASGALIGLTGIVAPPERVGAFAGAVGAAGALGGLLPPLLMAGVYAAEGSFGIGLTVLSALLLAAASMRSDGLTSAEREELALLRQENRRLRRDAEILRRAANFLEIMSPMDVYPPTRRRPPPTTRPAGRPDAPPRK